MHSKAKSKGNPLMLEEKLEVISEHSEFIVDIVRSTGISVSTLRTVRNQAEKIKECCKSATRMTLKKITQIRAPIIGKMKLMLAQWIEHQNKHSISLSTMGGSPSELSEELVT